MKQVGSGEVMISQWELCAGLCTGHQCPYVDIGPEAQTCPTAFSWLGELAGVRMVAVLRDADVLRFFSYPSLSQLSQRNVL